MLHVCYMTMIYTLGKGGRGERSPPHFDRLKIMIYLLMHCHKSITDTLDTVKGQTLWRLLVPMNNAKGILENLSRGMRMANWEMSAPSLPFPHVQKAPPPQEWRAERFVKERASIGKRTTTTTTSTRAGKTIGFMSKKKHYCTSITCTFC